jgi:hypothetical protein
VAFAFFAFKNTRQRIVFSCALSFISQELFDLFLMLDEKSTFEKDKSSRFASAFLVARWTNCRLRRTVVLGVPIPHEQTGRGPATVYINCTAVSTDCRFFNGSRWAVAAGFMINPFRKSRVCKLFVTTHVSHQFLTKQLSISSGEYAMYVAALQPTGADDSRTISTEHLA